MDKFQRIHPLDRLIKDDSLFMLEALVPFVDYRFKKLLILYIKYKEITAILDSFSKPGYISECGFDCHPKSTDDFISDICNFLPGDFSSMLNQIKQMQQMQGMMNMMNSMNTNQSEKKESSFNPFENITNNQSNSNNDSLFDSIISILDDETASKY